MTDNVEALRAQLLRRRMAGGGTGSSDPVIRTTDRRTGMPLSSGQRRLWFLDNFQPGSTDYLVPFVLRLSGRVNVDLLRRAWLRVIDRHEILRTRYRLQADEPVQDVMATGGDSFAFTHVRAPADGEDGPEADALRLAESLARSPMSPSNGDCARMHLVTASAERHYLVILFHHIAIDGWSERVLWRDLSACYQAESLGTEPDLAALPIQYRDYAGWQHEWLASAHAARSLRHWDERLSALVPLELPTLRARPRVRSAAGDVVRFAVPEALTRKVHRLAQEQNTTPFVVLLTAFQLLLARYTGREDVHVGIPVAGRDEIRTHELIGFFVNTAVVRTTWSGNPTFTELLARGRTGVLDALEHQAIPFETLVERFDPERDPSRLPLVQVMFGYQEATPVELDLPGVAVEPVEVTGQGAKFDLNLQIEDIGSQLRCALEYATTLRTAEEAERTGRHFMRLLESVCAQPDAPLSDLTYVTDTELHSLVTKANDTARKRSWTPLHEVVSAQARLHPEAPAVMTRDEVLDYGELETRANRLARHLRECGAGPETLVGVNLPRSPSLLVAFLAVLKAGAAYLPLETTDSANRKAYILHDARVHLVISDEEHATGLAEATGATCVLLDRDAATIDRRPGTDPAVHVDPDTLAYVIYTSGTTGRPKGVMNSHRGLINYLWWTTEAYLRADGGTALFSSAAFDLVVPNIYTALMTGRPVHLLPQDFDVSELGSLLLKAGPLSFLKMAPGHLELLADQLDDGQRTRLAGLVIAAGDRFTHHLADNWRSGTDRPLAAEYGPTEITIGNSAHFIDGPVETDLVPIGRPIPNTTAYVLDSHLRPVPVGVVGEVYVGGVGVTRGYIHQPGLTAEKYLPDPFSAEPGSRLYRTGDLARVLPDGAFDFIGRVDRQVKVRGYRVEPAEVENALSKHPQVQTAVVVAHRGRTGSHELNAYAAPTADTPMPDQAELRAFLADRLPAYMVPTAIVVLAEFPLTRNGKIDISALPEPGRDARVADSPTILPSTATEAELAAVWCEVLGVRGIGVRDSFFELGGDSLRAVALVGALRRRGFDVSVRDVFEHRTVEDLGRTVGPRAEQNLEERGVRPFELLGGADRALLPDDAVDAYPLSRIQLGMVLEMMSSKEEGNYHNVTSYLIRDSRPCAHQAFQAAVDFVVARHEVLRTSMDLNRYSEPVQLVHRHAKLTVGLMDLRGLDEAAQDAQLRSYMSEQRNQLFDLADAPLFRFFIHQYDEHWRMTFTEFHPILEGWSLHLMIMEVLDCYRRLRDGLELLAAPAPAIRYADFIALERRELADPVHAAYWKEAVAEHPPLALPEAWGDTESGPVKRIYIHYADLQPGLRELARRADASMKSVMHAAHLRVMASMTADAAFSAGLVCDTRPEVAGADRVYGMYLNTVPFPYPGTKGSWISLVRQVFRTEIELWPHRRFALGSIQRQSGGRRAADVCFAYLDFRTVDTELVDLDAGIDDSPNEFPLMVATHGGWVSLSSRPQDVSPARLDALGQMYRQVLAAMAADPEGAANLPLLSDADRAVLLREPAPARAGIADVVPAHRLVEQQVARTPNAIAVTFEDQNLTYEEVNARANRLAHRLQALGVTPESVVGVHLERSVELVVCLLAILKAGGAFLPMDPEHPAARHRHIVKEAAPALVVTLRKWAGALPTGTRVLCLDVDGADIAVGPADNLPPTVHNGDQLAYVVHTSGSTGRPKGVQNTHRGLSNELRWTQATYPLGGTDSIIQKTPMSFDVFVAELFWPLLAGARLIVARPGGHRDAEYLADLVERERITTLHFVPSMLAAFLAGPELARQCARLRHVVCSGEALTASLRERFHQTLPWARLSNLYGPAEAAIHATAWDCRQQDTGSIVPIGTPIDGVRAYVCDHRLGILPVGVPGELLLGGVGIARGYLNGPGQTADRFVPDPFSGTPGSRLYRTGDLARVLPTGDLEYLGRADRQIKLRGVRIEPAEIESVLRSLNSVSDAAVVARRDDAGDPRLVAYVVPAAGTERETLPDSLRTRCRGELPAPMVPAFFIPLERIPVSANGKRDLEALPPLTSLELDRTGAAPPRSRTELVLLDIWEEILETSGIGTDDNFFACGGHSLSAVRLLTTLHQRVGVRLPMSALFERPTVAGLAELISEDRVTGSRALVTLRAGAGTPSFWVHPMGGTAFCYRDLARALPEGTAVHGFQSVGLEPGQSPHTSVPDMAASYLAEARGSHPGGPWQLGGWSFGGLVAYEMARQLAVAGEEVAPLILIDPGHPLGDGELSLDEPSVMSAFLRFFGRLNGIPLEVDPQTLARLSPEALRADVLSRVRGAHLLPAVEEDETLHRLLNVFIANYHAYARYRPEPYDGAVRLLSAADEDPAAALERWSRVCRGELRAAELPGDHFGAVRPPNTRTVAAGLSTVSRGPSDEMRHP
ncbi:amino acid adenylation domain-containing protein [Streptomyces sp. NPDC051172]|uniref:amino acid adenylation domain-containing protein n=1 Tax=Streptomyces sp. NPDC051172 TaxID=3155796 RepID=UPI0034359A34